MRYYFNIHDGRTMLDEQGMELGDMEAVKNEAVRTSADLLKGIRGPRFWTGEPWKLWVTDQPNASGNTVLTLEFSSRLAG
jgi:hypothetical protein